MVSGPAPSRELSSPAWRLHGLDVALLWRPANATYAAFVPTLPGYCATGATRTDALKALASRLAPVLAGGASLAGRAS